MKKTFLLVVCLFLISYVPVYAARKYQIKQKFDTSSQSISQITDDEEIIGWNIKSSQGIEYTLFRYKDGQYQLTSFSSKQGTDKTLPLDVAYNIHGQVAFTVTTSSSGGLFSNDTFDTQLGLWDRGQESIIIGKPEGWNRFKVIALNDKGQILIQRLDDTYFSKTRLAIWSDGRFIFIPSSLMDTAVAFVDDFVYGNYVRDNYTIPRVFNVKTEAVKNLEFPENTVLVSVNEQQCISGSIMHMGIEDEYPLQGIYKVNNSSYSLIPENCFPLFSKEKGKIIIRNSKMNLFLFDFETNDLLSINENIIDENGKIITFKDPFLISGNNKGDIILNDQKCTYVLSPVEAPK